MDILFAIAISIIVFVLGASIGSFINVVVYRLPAKISILRPPSRCPNCLKRLKPYDNIPLLGWVWLRGLCRYCKSPIALRYPLVEGFTGIVFLIVFWFFQLSILTIGYWIFCSWLLILALIDLDTMTLPEPLTKSGLVLGLVFQIIVGWGLEANSVGAIRHLMSGIGGSVVGLWLFDTIALVGALIFSKAALGAGDTKLVAMMGAWIGWRYLLIAILIACISGVLVGGSAIVLAKHSLGKRMPFGPFLAFGGTLSIFCGEAILSQYLHLFFPMV